MKQHSFTLSNSGKEFPARFGGIEVTYDYPENLAEVLATQLPDGIEAGTPEADAIVYGVLMGQGIHLNKQKAIKEELGRQEGEKDNKRFVHADLPLEQVQALAKTAADATRMPKPGTRKGEGAATKIAKVEARAAKAEQTVDAAKAALQDAYTKLPKNVRAGFAADLVERGVFTPEEIEALNQQ